MAVIEFVDRDVEAKKVDKKNKDITKDIKEEKKIATAKFTLIIIINNEKVLYCRLYIQRNAFR